MNNSPSDLEYLDDISGKTGISITALRRINDSGYEIVPKDLVDIWTKSVAVGRININSSVSLKEYGSNCKFLAGDTCTFCSVDEALIRLKSKEPNSDNEFFRLAILSYEFSDLLAEVHRAMANLMRAIVYSRAFKDSNKVQFGSKFMTKDEIIGNGKLAAADLLTQLGLLFITLEWDFQELREIGLNHLKERHKDFKRDGWSEVDSEKK